MNDHPSIDDLLAYTRGDLQREEAHRVFVHCSKCAECGDELAALMVLRAGLPSVEEEPVPFGKYLAVAASVIILVGLGFAVLRGLPDSGVDPPAIADGATNNDSASLATRETLPQRHVILFFGAGISVSSNQGSLHQAVQWIVDGRLEDAERVLLSLRAARPNDDATSAYLGIARYLQGDTSTETEALLRVSALADARRNASTWYLANLLLARGDEEQSVAILKPLGDVNDRWGRKALALLALIGN